MRPRPRNYKHDVAYRTLETNRKPDIMHNQSGISKSGINLSILTFCSHSDNLLIVRYTPKSLIGSYGIKDPNTTMLCASSVSSLVSVYTPPSHMIQHRNFIFGTDMYPYP